MTVLGYAAVATAPAGTHTGGLWPVGLASGVLVLVPRRLLAPIALALALAAAATYALGGAPLRVAPAVGAAIAVEALVTRVVLTARWGRGRQLWDDLDLVRFALAALAGACTGGVLLAAVAAAAGYGEPREVLVATFVSHLVSELTLLAFFMHDTAHEGDSGPVERALRWSLTVAISLIAFLPDHLPALVFLVIPVVGWGALRAPMREALWQLLTVVAIAECFHVAGAGPFLRLASATGRSPELASVLQQTFLLGCALVCIPFAMAVARQQYGVAEIATERARLRRIVESATSTAIIETDDIGRIRLFNPGAQMLLGYSEDEVLGRFPDIFHEQSEIARQARSLDVPPDLLQVSLAMARPETGARDWAFRHRDGHAVMTSMTLVPIQDKGVVTGYLCTAEDVTERVRTQQALEAALATERRAVAQLTEIDRSKDAFVSSVSHELRTPITNIVGYLELLLDGAYGATTTPQHEALGRIDSNSQRLLVLIDDLLTLSSIESLDVELARRPVDLREVVERTSRRLYDEAAERDQRVELELPGSPVVVLGDQTHLERMVSNLASNAVKFTPTGGTVTLRVAMESGVGLIEVQDTGVGISEEERPMLFNRFYRSSYAQSEAIKGSGLGLAIARSIAHLHGARISADSTPGVGSTFRVCFDDSARSRLLPL
jgi:PAS domain S-box-containing protein